MRPSSARRTGTGRDAACAVVEPRSSRQSAIVVRRMARSGGRERSLSLLAGGGLADAEPLDRREHGRVVVAGDVQETERTLVEGAEDRVVDEHQVARLLDAELDDRRAAGGYRGGLHVVLGGRAAALGVDVVE